MTQVGRAEKWSDLDILEADQTVFIDKLDIGLEKAAKNDFKTSYLSTWTDGIAIIEVRGRLY